MRLILVGMLIGVLKRIGADEMTSLYQLLSGNVLPLFQSNWSGNGLAGLGSSC